MANTAIPPNITSTDPPDHDVWRAPLAAQLSVASLGAEAATMAATARTLTDRVLAKGSFDGVADLARPYSLTVVSDLVGIPEAERDVFPALAESAFNVMGATNHRTGPGMQAFGEIAERCMRMAASGTLCPGQRGVELVEAGHPLLLISYTWPGVDTTVTRSPPRCTCSPGIPSNGTSSVTIAASFPGRSPRCSAFTRRCSTSPVSPPRIRTSRGPRYRRAPGADDVRQRES